MLTVQERVLYRALEDLLSHVDEGFATSDDGPLTRAYNDAKRILEIFSVIDREPGYPNRVEPRPFPRWPRARIQLNEADSARANSFDAVRQARDALLAVGAPGSAAVAMTSSLANLEYGHVLRAVMNYVWVGPGECPAPPTDEEIYR